MERGPGGLETHAALQARGNAEVVGLLVAVRVGLERQVKIGGGVEGETGTQDADDGVRLATKYNSFAGDGGIGAEAALPEAIRQHDHAAAAGTVLIGREGPAEEDRSAEEPEELVRDVNAIDLFGAVAARDVDAGIARIGGDVFDDLFLFAPDVVLRHIRNRKRTLRGLGHELADTIMLG